MEVSAVCTKVFSGIEATDAGDMNENVASAFIIVAKAE